MRQRLPWLLALPVMAAGSLAAHSLTYLLVSARATENGAEITERARATASGASYLVLFIGMLAALTIVGALARLLVHRRGRRPGLSPWFFFVLPPLAFLLQELSERVLRAEAFPFGATLEPRFLIGLLLQLPFGLLALLLARVLLRIVVRIASEFAAPKTLRLLAAVSRSPALAFDLPRIPALALGYHQRGPPPR